MKKIAILSGVVLATTFLGFNLWKNPSNLIVDTKQLTNRLERTADFPVKPTQIMGAMNWNQFPEFHLSTNLKLVYMGARFLGDSWKDALKHGFTHINFVNLTNSEKPKVPPKQRAIMVGANFYTDQGSKFSDVSKQLFDPFEDNAQFIARTKNLMSVCELYKDCGKGSNRKLLMDIVCYDLENVPDGPQRSNLPPNSAGQKYNNAEVVPEFMKAMSEKYYLMLQTTRNEVVSEGSLVGSVFPGAPIINQYLSFGREKSYYDMGRRAWLWNIPAKNGKFQQEQLDFQTPSYYAGTGVVNTKQEVNNYLYDQETNAIWSKLPRIPVTWMFQSDEPNKPLSPKVAEAFAIFNFISGAKGVWFWDLAFFIQPNQGWGARNYACYEYYTAGLYRLSQHNEIFEGQNEAIIPEVSFDGGRNFFKYNALELATKSLPIVRAVVGSGKILVAAYYPKGQPNQKTDVVIRYKNWQDVISLNGDEVYLGKADLQ